MKARMAGFSYDPLFDLRAVSAMPVMGMGCGLCEFSVARCPAFWDKIKVQMVRSRLISRSGPACNNQVQARLSILGTLERKNIRDRVVVTAANSDDSYLIMWKKAKDRQQEEQLSQHQPLMGKEEEHIFEREMQLQMERERDFARILQVPQEERDRIQRMQVVDRAAAALAATDDLIANRSPIDRVQDESAQKRQLHGESPTDQLPKSELWTWLPKPESKVADIPLQPLKARTEQKSANPVIEREKSSETLEIPYETANPIELPPLQSEVQVEKLKPVTRIPIVIPQKDRDKVASDAVRQGPDKAKSSGENPDGSKWWKETGVDDRGDGVICHWSVTKNVSKDEKLSWEEKYWEACSDSDYKEMGSEKSGRDASSNVWKEFWKEQLCKDSKTGLMHIEKTAEKCGKNENGSQWSEKWWEHYDESGRTEKWADKYGQIDPNTPIEPGHAHIWHERWGEQYDGYGGSVKYTDKWSERAEFGGWSKWGDKWDEKFDCNSIGKKSGETWWEGANGEKWNRVWGEEHNGSGWVRKCGHSSCGEFWDTNQQEETWFEGKAHYGFRECLECSQTLQRVGKKSRADIGRF